MKKILVVEDDFEIQAIIRETLELDGFEVLGANNGLEALKILHDFRPALIFVDLMMPIMNGWELIKEIKQRTDLRDIPIVVVSAFIEKSKTLDSDGFLEKPIDLNLLLDMAHHYAERDSL